jgi:hypothetical protein
MKNALACTALALILGLAGCAASTEEATRPLVSDQLIEKMRSLVADGGQDVGQLSDDEVRLAGFAACDAIEQTDNSLDAAQVFGESVPGLDKQTALTLFTASIAVLCPELAS